MYRDAIHMFTDVVCFSKLKTIKTQQINNNYSMLMKHEKKIKTINKQKTLQFRF